MIKNNTKKILITHTLKTALNFYQENCVIKYSCLFDAKELK